MTEYNGWKNKATWSVSMWLNNEEPLYRAAVEFMKDYKGKAPYKDFCADSGLDTQKNPDGVRWISDDLDYIGLNHMMREVL